ncbi:hypothetical protein MGYG_08619 [Nannizzia gypsea CBS 118893]|uniref:Uncharacterized protein n=1 Tax=Arthroderma gypseum (strain ATCC MYA-4604 / CBS 118893) TaxID=535722 RepID=E4V6H9_ARTGP|nr:hypothetical protein MGYG_08619 [Nannizzia gypsea CBS 118893]EFQ96695.1 hypothetical protein MGYG_08619 [Nannizzia gypsea CBS 118893]
MQQHGMHELTHHRQSSRSVYYALLVVGTTIFCGFLIETTGFVFGQGQASIIQSRQPSKGDKLTYPGEKVKWEPCGQVEDRPLECSSITVPKEHFNTNNANNNETFSIPLVRMRGKNATQNLLVNPGGPGGSGFAFIYGDAISLMAVIDESHHLLSFDPRGVNSSQPLATCYPDQETRKHLSEVRATDPSADSPDVYAWTTNFARACSDTMGDMGKYINTPQTAADMNSILDAVGQDDMVYWGFSYGSILGQTYATMFPDRSKRVIIDGIANHFDWYNALIEDKDFIDSENVLFGIFDECIKAGSKCPLAALADSSQDLYQKFMDTVKEIKAEPRSVYVNNTLYGVLDYHSLWFNGVYRALYRPSGWYSFADRLAKLMQGDATEAFLAYGFGDPFMRTGDGDIVIHLNDGLSGEKHWPQERTELLDQLLPWYANSSFAFSQNKLYYAKQQWRIPRTHKFTPRDDVETAHPLLVLSMTFDPVCPLASAKVATQSFRGSRLVEVKGYGHCSQAVQSACATKHIRNFLQRGVLPDTHVQCDVDSEYYIKPE